MQNNVITFEEYIRQYHPNYVIDEMNEEVVKDFSLWAERNPKFEEKEGFYLDKGILLSGNVGTGKTDLFYLLGFYQNGIKTRYAYNKNVVWSFTASFNKKGYDAFSNQESGNMYYDELCLIDERTNFPEKERAMYFGSKTLVGQELIMFRYDSLKNFGFQTHFSTNANEKQLFDMYGERAYSRLTEMCNFMQLIGDSRRGGRPNIYQNSNIYIAPQSKQVTKEEIADNKLMLDDQYRVYLETNQISDIASLYYPLLKAYGVDMGSEEETAEFKRIAGGRYTVPVLAERKSQESRDRDKESFVNGEYKKVAIKSCFDKLKAAGAKTIFGEVDVKLPTISSGSAVSVEESISKIETKH